MRPSGAHLYKRVCLSVRPSVGPSVRPSVGPLRLCKNRVSRLFLATVRSCTCTETNDQPPSYESLFTRLFVHLSLHTYVTWSIHAKTQPGRIITRSGLFIWSGYIVLLVISKRIGLLFVELGWWHYEIFVFKQSWPWILVPALVSSVNIRYDQKIFDKRMIWQVGKWDWNGTEFWRLFSGILGQNYSKVPL